MLTPIHLRDLLVDPATHPRGQPHLSATSALVQAGSWLYLVSDDEHHIGMLQAGSAEPVELHRVLAGDLPRDKRERKKRKPDLEALAALPATDSHPHGALLALGSGSRPNRRRGWCIALDADSRLQRLESLDGAPKVEGIALVGSCLLMVTDADDPAVASQLLAVEPGR